MPRKISEQCPKAPDTGRHGFGMQTKDYEISVITPMFGGGAEPSKPDPITAIRPPSIRGHLRFWWRATRGASCSNAEKLFEEEGKIWGTVDYPSRVSIDVRMLSTPTRRPCAKRKPRGGGRYRLNWEEPFAGTKLPYVLFPFQGQDPREQDAAEPAEFVKDIKFKLVVKLQAGADDLLNEIEAAVWAWVSFGGIGARTRRGCGALFCPEFAPENEQSMETWLEDSLKKYNIEILHKKTGWACLSRTILVKFTPTDAIGAWQEAVNLLRTFRQEGQGRKGRGLSNWPEADSIRRISGRSPKDDRKPKEAFPRAELGLPIIFHFVREKPKLNDHELIPARESSNRMASPIIIRPIQLKNGKCLPLILILQGEELDLIVLKRLTKEGSELVFEGNLRNIRNEDFSRYPGSPMRGLSEQGSALEAFVTYAQSRGFRNIVI